MTDLERLKEKAAAMPDSPGVYQMKDASGRIIYVGKAKSLPKRVSSYFQKSGHSYRIADMVSKVHDVDFIVTDTEQEALILENTLIKKHKPKYNVILRDDKTYPSLRLNVQDPYPRLEVVRRVKKDGAVYFGPFSSATAMRKTLALVQRIFPLRQCKRPDVKAVDRPCLNHELGRCLGPCGDHATPEEYRAVVDEVIMFFQGRNQGLVDIIKKRMQEAAERLDFEAAARYRDRLTYINRTLEKQKVVSSDLKDRDVIGLAHDRGQNLAVILYVRRGAVHGSRNLPLGAGAEANVETLESLISQYYGKDTFVPEEVLLPAPIENQELLQDWLSEKKGRVVKILWPQRGDKKKLVDLAAENAASALTERLRAVDLGADALYELQRKMGLPNLPRRIEGYDMSTLRGQAAVGAMVVLEDGHWQKSDYRRYRIKNASGQDDYAMMSEVLTRRLAKDDLPRPELMLLDGGRGQLGMALAVVRDLNIENPPPMAGLAKGKEGDADKVYLPGRVNPVDFRADNPGLLLLMRIRDESHRYVRTFHHRIRAKDAAHSELEDIPGVGPGRRKKLLTYFGSMENIKKASLTDLEAVLSHPVAQAVLDHFTRES
jgi:excinuclease ABC subunit C